MSHCKQETICEVRKKYAKSITAGDFLYRAESVRIHSIDLKQKISEEAAWISRTRVHQRITFGETCQINLTTVFRKRTVWPSRCES